MTNKERAERIANELFVNGSGERADRLMLTKDRAPDHHIDLGGWGLEPIIDKIKSILDTCQSVESAREVAAVRRRN